MIRKIFHNIKRAAQYAYWVLEKIVMVTAFIGGSIIAIGIVVGFIQFLNDHLPEWELACRCCSGG
jgi:hypothetical protein